MVVQDLKSSGKKIAIKEPKEEDGDDDLYNLVRGGNTMVIQRLDEKGSEDFIPRRRVCMMISSDDSDGEDFVPIRDLKNTEDEKDGVKKNNNKRPLTDEKSGFRVEKEKTQSKASVSSSSPFTPANRNLKQPLPLAEPKFVSSPSRDRSAMSQDGEADQPVTRLMMEKAQEQIRKQNEFISSMASYLQDHNRDAEQLKRRRDGQEAKFLEGTTDPEVRRNIMTAHREECREEREADNRAARTVERTRERAPKRRPGNSRPLGSQPPQYPGISGLIRDVRAKGEKDVVMDKIIDKMPVVIDKMPVVRINREQWKGPLLSPPPHRHQEQGE
jgi:hypothetical protein